VICHEISIRYALSAAAHANDLDRPYHVVPNATPYLFGADVLIAAANRLELLAEPPEAMPAVEAIAREAA
jgi:hypothetical protein